MNQKTPTVILGQGQTTYEEKANKWFFTSCKGGHGKYRIRGAGETTDQFYDSNSRTETGEMTLPPLATEGIALGGAVVCKPVTFNGSIYFFGGSGGTRIRRFNGTNYQYYRTAGGAAGWVNGEPGGGETAQTTPAALVYAMVYNGYLFMCCTANYLVYNGDATWTTPDPAIPAKLMIEFQNKLINIDATGQIRYSVNPESAIATWTAFGTGLYIDTGTPTSVTVYEDGGGDPAVYVGTTTGPYILNLTTNLAIPLNVRFGDEHADNCKGMTVWNQSLVFAKGGDVAQYLSSQRGSQNLLLGPGSKDDGLRATRTGRVNDIDPTLTHVMLVAIDAGSTTGQLSSVMAWVNGAWHTLAEADVATESIEFVAFSTVGSPRIWWGQASSIWWMPYDDVVPNPIQASGSTYRASSQFYSPWMGPGVMPCTAIDILFETTGITTNESIIAYYRLNGTDTGNPTTLGTVSAATNGLATLSFTGNGITFYTIRIELALARGSTTTNAPRIKPGTCLRWIPSPQALWGWQFELKLPEAYKGRTWLELETALIAACDGQVVSFSHSAADDRKVTVEDFVELTETGHGKEKRFRLTVAEMVAT